MNLQWFLVGLALGFLVGHTAWVAAARVATTLRDARRRAVEAARNEAAFQARIHVGGHNLHSERDHADRIEVDTCQCCVLSFCKTCHGAEGTLPTECPGRPLEGFEQTQVMAGSRDFRGGRWVRP